MEETQLVPNQNPITLTPPVATYPTPAPSTPSKTPLLVTIIVLLVGIASYFVYQSYQLKQLLAIQQPSPTSSTLTQLTETTSQLPVATPTQSLSTFTNTKYSYSFDYPQQYDIKNNNAEGYDSSTKTSALLEVFNPNEEPTLVFRVNAEQVSQDFARYANTIFTSISTFKFPESDKKYQNPLGSIKDNIVVEPIEKEVFNGMDSYTFTIQGNFIGTAGLPTKKTLTTKYILLNSRGIMYTLSALNPSADINQLLNTFKFTK